MPSAVRLFAVTCVVYLNLYVLFRFVFCFNEYFIRHPLRCQMSKQLIKSLNTAGCIFTTNLFKILLRLMPTINIVLQLAVNCRGLRENQN